MPLATSDGDAGWAMGDKRLQAARILADLTLWTAEQWIDLVTASLNGRRPDLMPLDYPTDEELRGRGQIEVDPQPGLYVFAYRPGPHPVKMEGRVYTRYGTRLEFDPGGRFFIHTPGWRFYRRVDVHPPYHKEGD